MVRVFSRMRWWCTAEVRSNDGIGAHSASESRSDSTSTRMPAAMAADASLRTRSSASRNASPPPATRYKPEITWERNSGRSPSWSMWMSLANSSLSITGNGNAICTHDSGVGSSTLPSAPMVHDERRDQLFADGVERRVGDLRELLREVVEQHPRALRQHRDRRVGAHRPERLATGARHRRHEQPEILVGVAERLLATDHRLVRGHVVLAVGQVAEVHEPLVEPVAVGVLGRERALDLLVVDDAALRGVDEEDLARLQATLLHDARGVDVDHAGLARHDHPVVVGDPEATRAQAVAVEHRTDHGAVGERDRRGAVPRLHQRRVVAVEGALLVGHGGVVLPRLRDHHQHRVPDRASAEREQLEALVEARGVGRARRDDRERALQARGATAIPSSLRGRASSCGCPAPC